MKKYIIFIHFFIIYTSSGVQSNSLSKDNHLELPDTLNCKICSLIVEKFESIPEVDFSRHLAEFENVIEKVQPFCKSLQKIKPDLNCNLLDQFANPKKFTCGYLTHYCSEDIQGMYKNMM